jgi:GGDEF domain-containing protein
VLATLDPTQPVQEDDHVIRILFLGDRDASACAVLVPETPLDDLGREALTIVASLGTAALASARKVDAIARTGLKDPETSAYTFAYFGDVAGREIDRAARHNRRFALLTIGLEGIGEIAERVSPDLRLNLRRLVTDAVLSAVRDSDVLARVEDDEFYLLLPETGLLGALAARRRILARFESLAELPSMLTDVGIVDAQLDLVCGVAVYPLDGRDLGRLLRVSRRRSERSREGVWRRMGLSGLGFWDALDRILGSDDDVAVLPSGEVSLHRDLVGAHGHRACHAVVPRGLLPRLSTLLTEDAVRHKAPGVLYAMGDGSMTIAMQAALDVAETGPVRGWVLDSNAAPTGVSPRTLRVDDPRIRDRVLLLALTELGGYLLIARPLEGASLETESVLAYHASDLDLVDGLVASLQRTYHLQPEIG